MPSSSEHGTAYIRTTPCTMAQEADCGELAGFPCTALRLPTYCSHQGQHQATFEGPSNPCLPPSQPASLLVICVCLSPTCPVRCLPAYLLPACVCLSALLSFSLIHLNACLSRYSSLFVPVLLFAPSTALPQSSKACILHGNISPCRGRSLQCSFGHPPPSPDEGGEQESLVSSPTIPGDPLHRHPKESRCCVRLSFTSPHLNLFSPLLSPHQQREHGR